MEQQASLPIQILSKTSKELQYVKRTVFMKIVITQNQWTFELGSQEGVNVPFWNFMGFQQKDRQNSAKGKIDTFYRPLVTSAQVILGTETYADAAIPLSYNNDECSQFNGQIKEAFEVLTKDDILQSYISDQVSRSCNESNDVGYNLFVFDICFQKTPQLLNQMKRSLKLLELFLIISIGMP